MLLSGPTTHFFFRDENMFDFPLGKTLTPDTEAVLLQDGVLSLPAVHDSTPTRIAFEVNTRSN